MEEEFRFHLEMEAAQREREGASKEEARRLALATFGGVERHKEAMRDSRGARWLGDLRQDIHFAVRTLARRPGFAIMALLTIAVGIGATTAVFTLANAVLFLVSDAASWITGTIRPHSSATAMPMLISFR